MNDLAVSFGGVDARLMARRAIFLPASRTLLVADVHWGKSAAFRAAAIPVPPGTTSDDLERLSKAILETGPARLVILGDLLHAKTWNTKRTHAAVSQWRQRHARLPIVLVRGNHDLRAGDPTPDLDIECVGQPFTLDGLKLCHQPCEHDGAYTLAGHIHPCFTLRGAGRQRERLPCFVLGPRTGMLPAFGSFTGMSPVNPSEGRQIFVIAGDEVIQVENLPD